MRPVFRTVAIALIISCAVLRPQCATGNWEVVDCVTSEISKDLKPGSALSRLKDYIESPQNKLSEHELEITPFGAKLKVGVIVRDQKRFLSLCTRAMNEGSLREIDTGPVVGPKVFIMLNHLVQEAPKSQAKVIVKGTFSNHIFETASHEQGEALVTRAETNDPEAWTEQEVRDFNSAVNDLGISRCKSDKCAFIIRVENGMAAILLMADGKPI